MTLALGGSTKAYRQKAFFTEPYIFHSASEKPDLEVGGWSQKLTWEGGTISLGEMKNN